jgi:hypothetical protein
LKANWKDRANWLVKKVRSHTPIYVVIRDVIDRLEALIQGIENQENIVRLKKERSVLLAALYKFVGNMLGSGNWSLHKSSKESLHNWQLEY